MGIGGMPVDPLRRTDGHAGFYRIPVVPATRYSGRRRCGLLAGVVGIWSTHYGGRLGAGFADDLT